MILEAHCMHFLVLQRVNVGKRAEKERQPAWHEAVQHIDFSIRVYRPIAARTTLLARAPHNGKILETTVGEGVDGGRKG